MATVRADVLRFDDNRPLVSVRVYDRDTDQTVVLSQHAAKLLIYALAELYARPALNHIEVSE